jgi:uncharacterized protein (DUF2236 family)
MPLARVQSFLSRRFRALLSATPNGELPWLDAVAKGEGPGFFLPNEAPWVVHADMATLVGGVRALLMQAMHPGSLAGVREHSRYKDDPLGRLAGTIQWLTVTTYASRASLEKEAARVRAMHSRVRGTYRDSQGHERTYDASDPHLLLWVHIAFMESFLRCHQTYSATPIPGGPDAYIRLWGRSVEPLGLHETPSNEPELLEEIRRFEPELCVTDATREVLAWLRNPPLPPLARFVYRLLFQAAVVTLPPNVRAMLGSRTLPPKLLIPITRVFLRILRFSIGPEDPIREAATARLQRSGLWPA